MTTRNTDLGWWGDYVFDAQGARRWRIGPLVLWIARRTGEWRIGHRIDAGNVGDVSERGVPATLDELETADAVVRYGARGEDDRLSLMPALADRAVVSRPDRPFVVPGHEEVTLYVGTPLWLRAFAGASATLLRDVPIQRPSDTWLGPPTHEGELCYASRTFCRLHLDDVPVWPHRAVSVVTIRNRSSSPLAIERLKLPVTSLGLYVAHGRLWTEAVTLEWVSGTDLANFAMQPGAPLEAGGGIALAPPRAAGAPSSAVVRAFSTLFG
ncbi:MAG: hypothetical protein AAB426_01095 [Myxococcota bacterium]